MSYLPHDFEQDVARLRIDFAEHTLRLVVDGDVKVYRMEKPGTFAYHVDLVFLPHPKRIVITGDLCLGVHGAVSCGGYGFDWFCERLSDTYLCEKFLHREYDFESTKAALLEAWWETKKSCEIDEYELKELARKFKELGIAYEGNDPRSLDMADFVDACEYDQAQLYYLCCAFGFDGMQHVYKDAPALVVAQETFRRLIHELPAKEGGLKAEAAP